MGAGTGAVVGRMAGPTRAMKGGVGSASAALASGHVVGALAAVNAIGDVYDVETGVILAGARHPTGSGWLADAAAGQPAGIGPAGSPFAQEGDTLTPGTNTTIAVVATDAPLTKAEAGKLAQMAHDGLALAIRPAHLPFDGDTVFVLGLARPEAVATQPAGAGAQALAQLGMLATRVLARAIGDAVRAATGLHGVPSARELMASG